MMYVAEFFFFFSSRRRHTRLQGDWSSDVCSSDLVTMERPTAARAAAAGSSVSCTSEASFGRSEERRVGKSVDLGGRRIIKKKKKNLWKMSTLYKRIAT